MYSKEYKVHVVAGDGLDNRLCQCVIKLNLTFNLCTFAHTPTTEHLNSCSTWPLLHHHRLVRRAQTPEEDLAVFLTTFQSYRSAEMRVNLLQASRELLIP